jgi:RNA polymerase sigma-70 factor (ECF subfamily)
MTTESDEELVAAIRTGDNDAAVRFERRFSERIQALARKQQVPADDCGDIVQNVLADALRQIRQGTFRGAAALSTWLYPIINGKLADYWRTKRGPPTTSLETLRDRDHQVVASNPTDVLAVQQALVRLPSEEHLLLWMHEAEGYTLEEIGPLIGLRKSAVAERLARARQHFRSAIRDGGKNPGPQRLRE